MSEPNRPRPARRGERRVRSSLVLVGGAVLVAAIMSTGGGGAHGRRLEQWPTDDLRHRRRTADADRLVGVLVRQPADHVRVRVAAMRRRGRELRDDRRRDGAELRADRGRRGSTIRVARYGDQLDRPAREHGGVVLRPRSSPRRRRR